MDGHKNSFYKESHRVVLYPRSLSDKCSSFIPKEILLSPLALGQKGNPFHRARQS